MKKLLLTLLLVGFRVNGADKPIPSATMLEGFGTNGVKIGVLILGGGQSLTFGVEDKKIVVDQVELQFRRAGFEIIPDDKIGDYGVFTIILKRTISKNGKEDIYYMVEASASRKVTFKANGKEYQSFGSSGGLVEECERKDLRSTMERLTNSFLTRWSQVNRKRKRR